MGPKKSSDPVARAVAKLPKSKGTLSEGTEQAILGHGAAAIEPLLEVMNNYKLDSYAPMHAARLLGQLKAEAAIEPMIEIIIETEWDDRLHDAAILALGEIGPAVVEPILARWNDFPDGDDEVRPALAGALASCGAKDERIYQLLLKEFEGAAWRNAGELAAYGDERAIPVISKALDESRFGVDGEELNERAVIDLCDSLEELGGELSPAQQERVDQVRARLRARYDKGQNVELSVDDAELSDLLDSNEDAMTLAAAKGFLTAIVSGPTTTMPSAWLDVVLGEEPAFDSQEHADRIFGLLMNLHNQLIANLDEGKPVAPSEPEDDVEEWCAGYLEAAEMDSAWMADEESLKFLFPMSVLSGDFSLIGETDAKGKVIEDPTPQVNACRARLDRSAHDAYQYWLAWRRSRSTVPVVRKEPKVGRNEACPCGSGKKFKKCCNLVN